MTENKENTETTEKTLSKEEKKKKRKRYALFMSVILILVVFVDSYTTSLPNTLQPAVATDFLGGFSVNEQNAILAIGSAIFSLGLWFVFFFQYSADTYGRKRLLFITVLGMAVALFGIIISTNYIMYVIFMLFLLFFFNSDIWMIYVAESVKPRKRAKYTYLLLFIGTLGGIIMAINRMIFIANLGFWKGITFLPIIVAIPLSLVIAFKLKETPRFQQIQTYRAKKGKPSFKQQIKSVFQIEERKSYVTMLWISFIFGLAFFATSTLIQKYITDIGYSEAQLSTALLFSTLAVTISFGSNSVLVEKFGRKKMMIFFSLMYPIIAIVFVIIRPVGGNQALMLLIIFMFLISFVVWGLNSLLRIYTLEFLPTQNRGTGLGLRTLVMSIGGTLGLFLSAPLILLITLGPTMILLVCLCFIIVPLGILRVKETKGVDLSDIK
ncbi:MAG: MFS transporter [Promethearchaeota archaeon]|jgi:MFS family permease